MSKFRVVTGMWIFSLHSLFREYGLQFMRHVALRHPARTARAVAASGRLDLSGGTAEIPGAAAGSRFAGARAVVGVGFCLKPLDPACISGRANHECRYLERLLHAGAGDMPACCRQCAIREIGVMSLEAGAAFYIMTSARDILFDVFMPALDEARFNSGIFALCRYSMRPFAIGMLASGIGGRLFAFERGDCRDYKTWLRADEGIKDEQTELDRAARGSIWELLGAAAKHAAPGMRFERRGNVLYPRSG